MSPMLKFSCLSFAAFMSGVTAYTGAHQIVSLNPISWFLIVEAGLATMGVFWWGLFSKNPFGGTP